MISVKQINRKTCLSKRRVTYKVKTEKKKNRTVVGQGRQEQEADYTIGFMFQCSQRSCRKLFDFKVKKELNPRISFVLNLIHLKYSISSLTALNILPCIALPFSASIQQPYLKHQAKSYDTKRMLQMLLDYVKVTSEFLV